MIKKLVSSIPEIHIKVEREAQFHKVVLSPHEFCCWDPCTYMTYKKTIIIEIKNQAKKQKVTLFDDVR